MRKLVLIAAQPAPNSKHIKPCKLKPEGRPRKRARPKKQTEISYSSETPSGCSISAKPAVSYKRLRTLYLQRTACVDIYGPRHIATVCLVWFRITIADVYPASLSGPIHRHREPGWISSGFPLIGSKASAELCRSTRQVQEATVRVVFTIPCQVAAIFR